MQSIIVICCYFGKLPAFFPAWLVSCENNPTIHFLLVTDQEVAGLPENVEWKKSSLSHLKVRIKQILGFEPRLKSAYKLCDYKVLYGLLFQEYCKGYDFWGHCDMDMVFGNLRKYLTDNVLMKNDRIYPYGHLALYRNTEECNRRFMHKGSPYSYREVFTSDEIFFFDERCYMKIYAANGYPCYDRVEMADIRTRHKRFCVHNSLKNYRRQLFLWHAGHVLRIYAEDYDKKGVCLEEEEFPYIHFKRRMHMQDNIERQGLDEYEKFQESLNGKYGFAISESGFSFLEKKPDINTIQHYNPYHGKITEYLETMMYEAKSKWKHLSVRIHRIIAG